MQTPAALVAIPFLIGSAAGMLLADTPDGWLPLCAAAAAVLSMLAAAGFFADDFAPGVVVTVAAGCLLSGVSLGLGAARAAYRPELLAWFDAREPEAREGPAPIEGVLREDASLSPFGASITIDVSCGDSRSCGARQTGPSAPASVLQAGARAPGGVRLTIGGTGAEARLGDWRAGRTVRLPARLRRPASFGNPGLPDEGRALARRGIVLVGSVKSAALVEVVAPGTVVEEAAAAARAWARRQLARHVGRWSPQSGAIASAILIGDRSGLSDEDERRLQQAGTYHVIAISGGNIAILTALLLFAMRRAAVPPAVSAGVAIAVLLFYGQLTGAGASVSRAVTAACVFLGGRILDHRGPALNALAVAAVAGVASSPLAAFDAGFILSFGATLGILLGTPRWLPARASRDRGTLLQRFGRRAGAGVAGLFVATACAELALGPIGAALFSRITIAGLILNFAAIPLMTVAQIASMAALAAAPFADSVATFCGYVAHLAASGLIGSARLVDVAPWLSHDVARPAWWVMATYYASCGAMLARRRRYVRSGVCGVAVSAALMLSAPAAATGTRVQPQPSGTLRVAFLDVGQGDATVAMMPDGRTLLVDAGGLAGSAFDIGERVLAPSLRAFGVRRLDTLVVTHGDPDHIGGAPAVLKRFSPRAVWEGVPVPPHPGLRALAALASASGASWRTVQAGDRETAAGVALHVLHPPPPDWERQRIRNDDSLVFELRMGDVSVLLPGDIGREGEQMVIPRLNPGAVVILKAPHHGSATSSTAPFIKAAHPAAVVFSAGRGNRFGHPAPAVVDRYRGAGALVFRTDEDGAVVVDTDGRTAWITTWSGRRVSLPR